MTGPPVPPPAPIDGLKDIHGTVETLRRSRSFGLVGSGKLRRHLEDGRWCEFVLRDGNGTALNAGQGLLDK